MQPFLSPSRLDYYIKSDESSSANEDEPLFDDSRSNEFPVEVIVPSTSTSAAAVSSDPATVISSSSTTPINTALQNSGTAVTNAGTPSSVAVTTTTSGELKTMLQGMLGDFQSSLENTIGSSVKTLESRMDILDISTGNLRTEFKSSIDAATKKAEKDMASVRNDVTKLTKDVIDMRNKFASSTIKPPDAERIG